MAGSGGMIELSCGKHLNMALVKFASICDSCGMRGEEYSALPTCSECHLDLCFNCAPELDDYLPEKGPCRECIEDTPGED